MTVRAPLALVKRVAAGRGRLLRPHLDRRRRRPRSAWCPSGTATGCRGTPATPPRSQVGGKRRGRSAAGSAWTSSSSTSATTSAAAGDEVVLFGHGRHGEPTAQDWAGACGTINYEIVTRIGGRLPAATSTPTSHRRSTSGDRVSDRRVLAVAAGAAGVAAAGDRRCAVASAAARHRPARRRRPRRRSARCAPSRSRCVADDGVDLHVEVDEVDAVPAQPRDAPRAPELTVVFVHGYALNLDCWHFQRAAYRGLVPHGLLRPALARPLRPLDAGHATIDQLGHDLQQVLDEVGPRGPGRAGRPLDGRHDDHRARRAAPRAVRRPGRRRRR